MTKSVAGKSKFLDPDDAKRLLTTALDAALEGAEKRSLRFGEGFTDETLGVSVRVQDNADLGPRLVVEMDFAEDIGQRLDLQQLQQTGQRGMHRGSRLRAVFDMKGKLVTAFPVVSTANSVGGLAAIAASDPDAIDEAMASATANFHYGVASDIAETERRWWAARAFDMALGIEPAGGPEQAIQNKLRYRAEQILQMEVDALEATHGVTLSEAETSDLRESLAFSIEATVDQYHEPPPPPPNVYIPDSPSLRLGASGNLF